MAKFLLNADEALADDFTGNFVLTIPFGEGYIFLMGNHRAVYSFCVLFLLFNRLPESTGGCVVGAIKSSLHLCFEYPGDFLHQQTIYQIFYCHITLSRLRGNNQTLSQ